MQAGKHPAPEGQITEWFIDRYKWPCLQEVIPTDLLTFNPNLKYSEFETPKKPGSLTPQELRRQEGEISFCLNTHKKERNV